MIENLSGERGIRTPGPVTVNGFQDRRIRPLCHLSGAKIGAGGLIAKTNTRNLIARFHSFSMFKLNKLICSSLLCQRFVHPGTFFIKIMK
jgi:hypothetical protein